MNNDSITFWKGSSGYSAPGQQGLDGSIGKSAHFSAYSVKDSPTLYDLISRGKALTDNERLDIDEQYSVGDTILDCDGAIAVIRSLSPLSLKIIGTIVDFSSINVQGEDEYRAPVNDSSVAELEFYWLTNVIAYNGNTTNNPKVYNYRQETASINRRETPLWHHRHYSTNNTYYPMAYFLPDSSTSARQLYGFDGHVYQNTKSFVDEIASSGEYYCCKVILQSGLVIESIDTTIAFDLNYLHMIDSEITQLDIFQNFDDEKSITEHVMKSKYIRLFTGDDPQIKMYFEYSHEGKIYRMKIKITRIELPN